MLTAAQIENRKSVTAHGAPGFLFFGAITAIVILAFSLAASAQSRFEKRHIAKVEINAGSDTAGTQFNDQFRTIALEAAGPVYSTTRIRDAIEALYRTKKVDTVTVEASLDGVGDVELLFTVKRKTEAGRVAIIVGETIGDKVTEQELLFKLNLLSPGSALTEQTLNNNADEILDYLRERGFYRSEVTHERKVMRSENEVAVTFRVTPNAQAKVENFNINIQGYTKVIAEKALKLRKGSYFSRDRLIADVAKVKEILRRDDFLAPELEEPRVIFDSDANSVLIELTGKVGPAVEVSVESEKVKVGSSTQSRLLPVKREGSLDFAAIVEGERRLENYYQEQGYFFADVTPVCSASPQLADTEGNLIPNGTEFLCQFLGGEDLMDKKIEVKYVVKTDRRLTLTKLRLRGTDKITIADITTVLGSKEASVLGIIPLLGYGRGYTSASILEDDAATITSLMSELGYRDAKVRVNQGVSPNGEDLIITFVVEEGLPSVVNSVNITGNSAISTDKLLAELPDLVNRNYSRARVRNAVRKLSEYYSNLGHYDARVSSSIVEKELQPGSGERDVQVNFKIENEGKKVVINRILISGNDLTKTAAVERAIAFRHGEILRSADVYASEQNLYSTDAFSRVDIKAQNAGDGPDGSRLADVIVNLTEQPPRLMSYGGGYSTDLGVSGFFDIRHVNLFGKLWQGGARIKVSQRQQLVQFDFINPRFINDGEKRFAPLTVSLQYQRDSTVTRFFRSTFDKGTFGIVQRVDENGNPIDEFGASAGDPTINRFGITAETNRTISRKDRSILFLRYRFEDVRLFSINSLLIKDLLLPDAKTRISGFGATFVRDTRQNCSVRYSLLDLIAKGEPSEPCRYNASDPTKGDYLTAEYNVSLPALGASLGFHKFQVAYNYFYTIRALKKTTFAARAILGMGGLFSKDDRYTSANYPSLNGLLPISERFFAGGANTIRGFDFEEAGPRVVIVPTGTFRNSKGEQVYLEPFTVPFGGNALAVVNLEARVPVSKSIRFVPFYDGGNVFRKAGDIFKKAAVALNDIAGINQRAVWTHSVGLGLRLKTPVGGEFGVDYGHLLNPPRFLIPQPIGPNAEYRLRQSHIHFRFSQAF